MKAEREKVWPEAYRKGNVDGFERAREGLKLVVDWSPVQDLMNRIYTDGVENVQYVENKEDIILSSANSWQHFGDSDAWNSIIQSCEGEVNRRVSDLVQGKGAADTHRAVIQLCKGLVAIPERMSALAERIRADEAPEE